MLGSTFQKLDKNIPRTAANNIGRIANEFRPKSATAMSKDDGQAFCAKWGCPKVTADNGIEMFRGFDNDTIR